MRHARAPGCSPYKPSPEPTLHRAGEVHLPASMLWRRLALGSRWAAVQQRSSCAAAEIQQHHLKFSRKQQSARQGESAACQPTWLPKAPGTVAGLLGSHLIGAACPRAPRGAPCPCREGCSDRGTLGSRPKEPQGAVGMRHARTPGCSPHKPSPEPALHRAGEAHPPA